MKINASTIFELIIAGVSISIFGGGIALFAEVKTNTAAIARIEATVTDIKTRITQTVALDTVDPASFEIDMINPRDLKRLIIQPTLDEMVPLWGPGVNRDAAVNLLVGTVLQESVVGGQTRLKQINGIALGIFQIEPATHKDIWDNYLAFRPDKASFVRSLARQHVNGFDEELIGNLPYATAIARLKYWRRHFRWPDDPNDVTALGKIWDKHYNANPDHGFVSDYVRAYQAAGEF